MKNFKRILTLLLAVLLLCGTTSAFADAMEAPEASRAFSNADEEATTHITRSYTLSVGQKKQIIPNQSSSTGRFDVTLTSSDPTVVEIRSKRTIRAIAPGKCIVTATIYVERLRDRDKPVVQNFEITVVGGPTLAVNGVEVKDDEVIRLKVRKVIRLEVKYLNLFGIRSWSTSDPDMLKIVTKRSSCYFIPQKPGMCTITVRLRGGTKLSCKVLVTA